MTRKIERLVESSYSGLGPSPETERELLAGLPAERARPRRVPWAPIAAVLAIAFAFVVASRDPEVPKLAQDGAADAPALPIVSRPAEGVVPPASDDVHVRLLRGGRVLVVVDGEWKRVTLDELGGQLADVDPRRTVALSVDRDAPWVQVQWLLTVCAERRLPKVAFSVAPPKGRDYRLDATLPTDPGLEEAHEDIVVSVRTDGERYRFGDREAVELATVARWLAQAKAAAPQARGEIRATRTTPFDRVTMLLAEFRQAGYAQVDFFGTQLPDAATRAAATLPAPGGNALVFRSANGEAGDLDRAAEIVRQRLDAAGLNDLGVRREGETLLVARPREPAETAVVKALVERERATLEFHVVVEPSDPVSVQPGNPPTGFRWYPRADDPSAQVLCRLDEYGITQDSVEHVVCRKDPGIPAGKDWVIQLGVKATDRENMAQLTTELGTRLAIILDGKVHATPTVRAQIRDAAAISGFTEQEARVLAALLGTGPLPVRLVAEQ